MKVSAFSPATLSEQASAPRLLCVDLDGTLVATDTLWESLLAVLRDRPLVLLFIPIWLVHGRARLKRELAMRANLDVSKLPYRQELICHLAAERKKGRYLVLSTAADSELAHKIATHVGIFDECFASDGSTNLKGTLKLQALVAKFGAENIEYVGDSSDDLSIWHGVHAATVVTPKSSSLIARVRGVNARVQVFDIPGRTIADALHALRLKHFTKNILLFVPLALAHKVKPPLVVMRVMAAMLTFTLAASCVYVFNDLADLEHDRAHEWKKLRPFSSGKLSIPFGLILGSSCLLLSLGLSWWQSGPAFAGIVFTYLCASLLYSTLLKRFAIIDVLFLSSFYTLRILAGGIVAQVTLSYWLFAFSMFFFFSLAMAKRYSEIPELGDNRGFGRGYLPADRQLLGVFGVCSGYLAVLVVALYINSPEVVALYSRPALLWLVCPIILYWISRIWLFAFRGLLNEDPVVVALRDGPSWVAGLAAVCIVALAAVLK